jgi:HSP20 family protein
MALARRTPTSGLTPWPPGRQLQRRFEEMFGRSEGDEGGWLAGAWAPPVDLYEAADAWMLKAELPGLSKDAIHIEGHECTLTRRGERQHEAEVKEARSHRRERAYGSFQRACWLPVTGDADNVQASFKDGMLERKLPTHETTKPKRIGITG